MDRLLGNASAPLKDRVIDPKTGLLSRAWKNYFSRMSPTLYAIPSRLNVVSLSAQTGDLTDVDFSDGELLSGLYRLTYYTRVLSSGGGSITVSFGWIDGGVSASFEGITLSLGAGDTSGTMGESTIVRIDKASPVTYSTVFSGGSSYNLDVTLEKVLVL